MEYDLEYRRSPFGFLYTWYAGRYLKYGMECGLIQIFFYSLPGLMLTHLFIHVHSAVWWLSCFSHILLAKVWTKISIIMASTVGNDTAGIEIMWNNVRFSTNNYSFITDMKGNLSYEVKDRKVQFHIFRNFLRIL